MSWDSARYIAKAQLYWSRATARERGSEEFLLYVAFACEFLTRAVLTRVNPALNAANDTDSILYSADIAPKRPPRTVDLGEAIDRVQRLLPALAEFEVGIVKTLVEIRNRELHNDTSEITQAPANSVMPGVYVYIVKCCEYLKENLSDLLGEEDGMLAERVAAAAAKDRKRRVTDLIRIHKERFFSLSEPAQKVERVASKIDFESAVLNSGHHLRKEKCPSCAEMGVIVGTPVGRSAPILRGQEILEEVRISPSSFQCKCCKLEINGLDELISAGFDHEYRTLDELNPVEHLGIDPMEYVDIDQIVREYSRDIYEEYQDE